jgi:hypothetical protein
VIHTRYVIIHTHHHSYVDSTLDITFTDLALIDAANAEQVRHLAQHGPMLKTPFNGLWIHPALGSDSSSTETTDDSQRHGSDSRTNSSPFSIEDLPYENAAEPCARTLRGGTPTVTT